MKPNTPFAFLKIIFFHRQGAALEQYYLPILEMETVTVYRYLLASYDQGEKQYLLAQILNHLNIGFPQLLLAFDRLIAMGLIDLYEGRSWDHHPVTCSSCVGRIFFRMLFLNACLKKIGEKAVEDLIPARSLGTRRQVSFSQVFGLDAGEATVLPSKKQQFDMEMFKRMMGA